MSNRFTYNRPQIAIKLSNARHKMIVAGRGVGKTTILGDDMIDSAKAMPRGKEGFVGLTYFHLKTKSMPVIINHWEKLGSKKDKHYFVGRKAPKNWQWKEAYQPVLDYKNCIIFFNGYTIEFLSMDRPEMARSGSYDFLRADEAAKIEHHSLVTDIFPANRGNNDRFGHVRRHHGTMFTTTHALDVAGEWIYNYRQFAKDDTDYFYLEASAEEKEIFKFSNFIGLGIQGNTLIDVLTDNWGKFNHRISDHSKWTPPKKFRHLFTAKSHPNAEGHKIISQWLELEIKKIGLV
jgi:hypothetical protein